MITIVETPTFERQAAELLSEEERHHLFDQLSRDPMIGDVIPGLGGVRKLRIGVEGRGKRGGGRMIYYYLDQQMPVVALFVYAKNERIDLSPLQQKRAKQIVDDVKSQRRRT